MLLNPSNTFFSSALAFFSSRICLVLLYNCCFFADMHILFMHCFYLVVYVLSILSIFMRLFYFVVVVVVRQIIDQHFLVSILEVLFVSFLPCFLVILMYCEIHMNLVGILVFDKHHHLSQSLCAYSCRKIPSAIIPVLCSKTSKTFYDLFVFWLLPVELKFYDAIYPSLPLAVSKLWCWSLQLSESGKREIIPLGGPQACQNFGLMLDFFVCFCSNDTQYGATWFTIQLWFDFHSGWTMGFPSSVYGYPVFPCVFC